MQSVLSVPENIEYWAKLARPLVVERFSTWAETGEPINFFTGLSDLVLTLLLNIFLGAGFAEKHADELVPILRAYEWAMQKPQTKALPRWMSQEGRLLDAVEERMENLIGEEVRIRIENMDKYKGNMDYLQHMLNLEGGKFRQGNYPLILTNG
jgi:hypothetical protein